MKYKIWKIARNFKYTDYITEIPIQGASLHWMKLSIIIEIGFLLGLDFHDGVHEVLMGHRRRLSS